MGRQPEFSFLLLPDPLSQPSAGGKGTGMDARALVEVVVGCMRHVGFNATGSALGVPAELLVLVTVGREGQGGQGRVQGGLMGQGGVGNGEGGEGGEWERVAAWSQAAWAVEEQRLTVLPVVVPSSTANRTSGIPTGDSSSGSSSNPVSRVTYRGWVQGTPLAIRRSALLSLGSLAPLQGGGMGAAGEEQGGASSSSRSLGAWVLCVQAWLAGYRVGLVRSPSAEFLFPKHDASGAGSRVGGGSNNSGNVGVGNVGVGSGSGAAAGLDEFAAFIAPYLHAVKERIALFNSH
ncbi:unnamed protein product [Closterium sp. Naga37s-1]|nr:unnamed protein product [Closterium sp. Naga37s-1]